MGRFLIWVLLPCLPLAAQTVSAVLNAASGDPALTRGQLISIYGSALTTGGPYGATSQPLPTQLGPTQVTVDGAAIPLLYVSTTQINAMLPALLPENGATLLSVRVNGVTAASRAFTLSPAAPGIFSIAQNGLGPGAILHGGSSRRVEGVYPAGPGESVSLFLTGLGGTRDVTVTIGGQSSATPYVGPAPGFAGLDQINVVVPAVAGNTEVLVKAGGLVSRPGVILSVATTATNPVSLSQMWSGGRCSGSGSFTLTSPMDLGDVRAYVPLGLMTDSHVTPIDHSYFYPKDGGPDAFPVRAAAAGSLVGIQRRTASVSDQPRPESDQYRLIFEHSCTFYSYYDLLTSLDPAIVAAGALPSGQFSVATRIPVQAGQIVGRIGGRTLDLGVANTFVMLPGLLRPESYTREPWKVHTVDPLDYFGEPLRSQLLALDPRRLEPRGGQIDYDVDGRLAGNWFREGTNGYAGTDPQRYWAGHFSAASHYLDPTFIVISHGDFGGVSRQFWARGNQPDPATVGVESGVVRYELVPIGLNLTQSGSVVLNPQNDNVQGVLLVQMLDRQKVRMEVFPGLTASQVTGFTANAAVYVR